MKHAIRRDDRGLTLVELLVAIVILGIIIAPLLHSFITASTLSSKSRKLGDATDAARSVIETLDSCSMETLAASLGDGSAAAIFGADSARAKTVEGEVVAVGDSTVEFSLAGLEYGRNTFDAVVSLTADDFPDVNKVAVTQYTAMDAVMSQPGSAFENPDFLAARSFSDAAVALMSSDDSAMYTPDYFSDRMTRSIVITVRIDAEKNEVVADAVFNYSYRLTYQSVSVGEDGKVAIGIHTEPLTKNYSYEFYREALADGESPLTSIYFFFYPNYTSSFAGAFGDRISIRNGNDLTFSVFLIKQKAVDISYSADGTGTVTTVSDASIAVSEASYNADIRLYESLRMISPRATVYSNINRSTASGLVMSQDFTYRIFRGEFWYKNASLSGELVAAGVVNRMYGVTVSLYDKGADIETAEPVYVMTASKLD